MHGANIIIPELSGILGEPLQRLREAQWYHG